MLLFVGPEKHYWHETEFTSVTAGQLSRGQIIRFTYADDDQGGALPSGTVIYTNVQARIFTNKPTLALLEQGLETPEMFAAILTPGTLDLRHNDQYQELAPAISPYINEKFVIVSIQRPSQLDSRKYLRVVMRRFETAHINNLQ
jgi:hypothetical protein